MRRILLIILKIIAWIAFGVVLLFISATLLMRLPSVQTFIIQKVTSFVSNKTQTKIAIEEIAIIFPNSVGIKQLYAEDEKNDTLISLGDLQLSINLFSLIKKEINISSTEIKDLNATIYRSAAEGRFNFQFFIDAFSDTLKKEIVKDSVKTGKAWSIYAGEVLLENIKFNFNDSLGGNLLHLQLQKLAVDVNDINLQTFYFDVKTLQLVNAKGSFEISKKGTDTSTNTTKTIPLFVSVNKLILENVDFKFINKPDNQNMQFAIGKSQIRNGSFDLPSLTAKVGQFALSHSDVKIAMEISTVSSTVMPKPILGKSGGVAEVSSPFNIDVEIINLQNNKVTLDLDKNKPKTTGLDFQHLHVSNLSLKAIKSHYNFQNIKSTIESFTANERSGIAVKHFSTRFTMDTKHAEAQNLYLQTNRSKIARYASINFASWDALSKNIGQLKIKADIRNSVIDLRDIIPFAPELTKIEIIKQNLNTPININALIVGELQDISFDKLAVEMGKNTSMQAHGNIKGLPTIDKTNFDIVLTHLHTSNHDLSTFLPNTILSAFQLPEDIALSGSFKGMISDFNAAIDAHTSDGNFNADVAMQGVQSTPHYKGNVVVKSLNIGKILKQKPLLGKATLSADVDGKGFTLETMNVMLNAKIDSFFINKYTYSNLNIRGNIKDKFFVGHADIKDPNLDLNFDGKVDMNKQVNQYSFLLDIQGADLQNLNLTSQDIRLSAVADANIKAPAFDRMNGKASIKNIVLYNQGKKYEIDSLLFVSFNDDKRSSVEMNSAILKAKFEGNISLFSLPATISNHLNYYFKTSNLKKAKSENFSFELDINNSPLIYEVLIPNLKAFIPGKISGSFDSESRKLDFDASIINLNYAGNKLENFAIGVHSNKDKLDYSVELNQFANSQITLQKTALSGTVKNNVASINLSIIEPKNKKQNKNKETNKLNIRSELRNKGKDIYKFNILPKGFVINDENWEVPDSNYLEFGKNGVYVYQMNLQKDEQMISVNSSTKTKEADLTIAFKDFLLQTFSQIVEKDAPIARGKLDGNIKFENYHQKMAFVSDLAIEKAQFKGNDIGNISLKADNLAANKYTLSAAISGNENDISLKGYLQSHEKGMRMDLDLRLNKLNLASFQGFVSTQATRVSGSASGDIKVTGETSSPQINGAISLNKVGAQATMLNQYLTIDNGKITIDPKGIYFPDLVIHDTQHNTASIKGNIGMKDFKDYKFYIDVNTDNFMVMNSNRKNYKMLNGKMIVSSSIKIRGSDSKPDIQAKVKLVEGSNICFTVPESQLSADKGEGVVEFDIDTIRLNPIIKRAALQKKITSELKGINIHSNIELNNRSTLKLVLDPTQSDTLIVRGDANLSFSLDESGKMSLTGTYVISNGSYELTLQDIVSKKFLINKGSSIIWYGNPLDALIDITAQHNVKTSPADLLASGNGGKVGVDQNAAKNALQFYVKIFIQGALLKPNLRFGLDMEPTQQQALSGAVYAKITSLNANQSELDKQVFSLLVLGSFMPTANASGGGTDYNGIARSSASSILSSQLNALSAQYVKGVELNFDLQSYNDYAAGQKSGNTQLNVGVKKQFLDDKLSVQIGSNIGLEGQKASQNKLSSFTGNIVIEYKLTKDGNYRLKAFRQNQYEGLIYGVVIKTGAGIIYSRDYNTFNEIFKHRDRK